MEAIDMEALAISEIGAAWTDDDSGIQLSISDLKFALSFMPILDRFLLGLLRVCKNKGERHSSYKTVKLSQEEVHPKSWKKITVSTLSAFTVSSTNICKTVLPKPIDIEAVVFGKNQPYKRNGKVRFSLTKLEAGVVPNILSPLGKGETTTISSKWLERCR
jgi:hypothetical protein